MTKRGHRVVVRFSLEAADRVKEQLWRKSRVQEERADRSLKMEEMTHRSDWTRARKGPGKLAA